MRTANSTSFKPVHGLRNTVEYRTWADMLKRCRNPRVQSYASHGGRGIKVCERWLLFVNFYKDMGQRPEGMTLDRIDNDGDYEPSNCRWATRSEQERNKRTTPYVEYEGARWKVIELAEHLGVKPDTLYARIRRNSL